MPCYLPGYFKSSGPDLFKGKGYLFEILTCSVAGRTEKLVLKDSCHIETYSKKTLSKV